MLPKDRAFLWDISRACEDILEFVQDVTYERFEGNKLVRFAVERQLMVIGEAAAHLSEETRAAKPDIPWSSIKFDTSKPEHWCIGTCGCPHLIRAHKVPSGVTLAVHFLFNRGIRCLR